MKIEDIDPNEAIQNVKSLLEKEPSLSPALQAAVSLIILLVEILLKRLGLHSGNSSKPPSSDFGGNKNEKKRSKTGRKPGGQPGRKGTTLPLVDDPDEVIPISIDRSLLSQNSQYQHHGFERRQVFDIKIRRYVTEYQAEIVIDQNGNQFVAQFPERVSHKTQYGENLKAHAVYMSQYQLIPYERIANYFDDVAGIPLSQGSLVNFNVKAFELLEVFEAVSKQHLIAGSTLNCDETGINVNGKTIWLHSASNNLWTHHYPHMARGSEAMDDIGIIPLFRGILCHDHWKPYLTYTDCLHSLCNAHHLRELERAHEQDNQRWALNILNLLNEINQVVNQSVTDTVTNEQAKSFQRRYRNILTRGQRECPRVTQRPDGKKGKIAQSKSRNLLERLINFEEETLRFMTEPDVPFTNNLAENEIRMTKVQQKISGCFRSIEGAKVFCRIRGFLTTCRKHGVSAANALTDLFSGKLPDFVKPPS